MLYRRKLKSFDPEPAETAGNVHCQWKKATNTINIILFESNEITLPHRNFIIINWNDVAVIEEKKKPRFAWTIGVIPEFFRGRE